MKIYTSKNCLNCFGLKGLLQKKQIPFEEVDGTTTKSVAYLRARKVNIIQLPIVEEDGKFYTYDQYTAKIGQ
jgi:arsenate reductase-like glutaredoxin family protein